MCFSFVTTITTYFCSSFLKLKGVLLSRVGLVLSLEFSFGLVVHKGVVLYSRVTIELELLFEILTRVCK